MPCAGFNRHRNASSAPLLRDDRMNSPPATPLKQPNPNAAMDAKTMAAAAGAAGVAAAIACSKTCAADAGGGDTVRHLYRAPGLPPPRGDVTPRRFRSTRACTAQAGRPGTRGPRRRRLRRCMAAARRPRVGSHAPAARALAVPARACPTPRRLSRPVASAVRAADQGPPRPAARGSVRRHSRMAGTAAAWLAGTSPAPRPAACAPHCRRQRRVSGTAARAVRTAE